MKEFLKEHALLVGAGGLTFLLGLGKVAFGMSIGWLWVFSPIWMLLLFAFGCVGLVTGLLLMAAVALAGVLGVAMTLDSRLEDEAEGWTTDEPEADAEPEVEPEAGVDEEVETPTEESVH